jgi:CheY-like chemotaxis protein
VSEKEHRLLPLPQVLKVLRDACNNNDTGAFFIATEEGHWSEIVLEQGKIICIRYRTRKGMEAVPELAKVQRAKFSFSAANDVAVYRVCQTQQMLPSTGEILQLLDLHATRHTGHGASKEELKAVVKPAAGEPEIPSVRARPTTTPGQPRPQPQTAPPQGGAAAPAPPVRPPMLRKTMTPKVLVVEDSTVSRKVITSTLSKKGYQILEAEDGFQALAQLSNEAPDLVLLDLILPGMDGYKVLAHMKKKESFINIPVIILTAKDTLFDKLRGKMSGSDEYLTKPFSPTELLAKVEKYLG